ncbi:MAG: hypothetical protein QM811_03225 [Pirellulales bacterium]
MRGISDPAIDKLIQKVIFRTDRDDQVAAVKALDRVLLHHHYADSELLRADRSRIAYWDKFDRPKELPNYSCRLSDRSGGRSSMREPGERLASLAVLDMHE